MKLLITILLVISPLTDLEEIARVNDLKKKAKAAYVKGDYKQAVQHYAYLLDSMQVEDPNITLNLANAYYQLKDSANAADNYNALLNTKDRVVKSVAHQQLGIMADRTKKFDLALDHFKNAIKTDPTNDEARYNYEMLKKMLDEQKKNQDQQKDQQDKQQENKDQENKDQQQKQEQQNKEQQKQDQKGKEGEKQENEQKDQQSKEEQQKDAQEQKDKEGKEGEEKKDQQPKPEEGEENKDKKSDQEQMQSISDKLKDMKISEEKAKMILEALKNNEIQYIQQNKRKATKRKDPNKPDW